MWLWGGLHLPRLLGQTHYQGVTVRAASALVTVIVVLHRMRSCCRTTEMAVRHRSDTHAQHEICKQSALQRSSP